MYLYTNECVRKKKPKNCLSLKLNHLRLNQIIKINNSQSLH